MDGHRIAKVSRKSLLDLTLDAWVVLLLLKAEVFGSVIGDDHNVVHKVVIPQISLNASSCMIDKVKQPPNMAKTMKTSTASTNLKWSLRYLVLLALGS